MRRRLLAFTGAIAAAGTFCGCGKYKVVPVMVQTDLQVSGASGLCSFQPQKPFDCSEAGAQLKAFGGNPQTAVIVRPDRMARYEQVGTAIQSLHAAGFVKVSFGSSTRPQDGATPAPAH